MKDRPYYQYMKTQASAKNDTGKLANHIADDMSFPKYSNNYHEISDYLEKNPYLNISLDTFDESFSDYKEWLQS
jgi:uncharacterized protein YozE (UPF0346 family)